jgi:hypothetical protein
MGTSATADFRGKDYVDEAVTIAGWDAGSNPTVAFGAQLSSSNGPIAQASRTFGVSADLPADPLKVSAQALNRDDVRRVYGNLVTVGNYDQDLYSCSQADFERYIDSLKDAGYNCYILHIGWQNHMPLPGVGNFVLLDKRVAYLDKVGMPYILAFDWGLNNQPGWLDFDLMEDQSGDTQVWNGYQRLPTTTDPKFRAGIASFIHAAQAHYMADKNLIGYEFLGIASDWLQPDAPYLGITVDYSPAARTAFQRYLHRVRRFELPDLNKRYGTSYKTYQEVPMPSPSYEHPIDVSPQWRDFMAFKVWYSSDYIRFVADAIRAFDQRRNITVYSMGGAWMPYAVMKAKGISVANGGAEGEHQSAPRFSRELMYGIPDRTESVSTEFSSEIRVDSNVFNMLSNGGLGTSINNYWKAGTPVYPGVPGARQKAYWLKWTKILDELKDTAPTVDDVAVVSSPAGLFYAVRTVFGEVAWYPDWDQERIIANAENLRPHWLYEEDLPDGLKGNRMAILFGSCASLIEPETVTSLVNYVKQGGTLVIDTKSGSAIPDPADTGDALWRALGLPTAKSYPALFGEKVGKVDVPVADTGKAWLADGLVSLDNPAYFAKNLPGGTPLLSDAAGRAVCWQFPVGAGTVIAFTGQLNYPRCKPFLGALYRMLGGRVPVTPSAPEIKTAWLTGKNAHYLVAHRYLTQGYMGDASSDARIRALGTQSGTIALNALQPGSYRIECLTDLDTPPMTATADSLKAEGVPFTLHKGETAVWRVSAMSKP